MSNIYINARFLTQPITGVQRFAIEICKEIRKINRDIIFVCPRGILHQDIADYLSVKIIGYNKGHLWEKVDLPLYLRAHGSPLLISLCNTSPLFYSNQFVTIHDMAVFENPSWFSKKFASLYKLVYPLMVLNSQKILTVSEFSKKEIQKYLSVDSDKIIVIPNSVEHCKKYIYKSESKYGNYVLCVGSVEPRKNLKLLIKAFYQASLSEDFNLVIVGGKNKLFNSLSLEDNPKLLEKVIFTGYVSDEELSDLYMNAKLFVYPSLYEGFGIPPLEAMFYECPTIVSNIESLREVCGTASLYFNPCDVEEIISVMNKVLDMNTVQINNMIAEGRFQVGQFSWNKSAMILCRYLKDSHSDV